MLQTPTEILVKARKEKGLTQTQVANSLGIGLRMYQKIEDGQFPKYKTDNIKAIDEILDTKLFELLYEQNIHVSEPQTKYNTASNDSQKLVPVLDTEFSAGFVEQIRDKQPEILTYTNMPEVQGCDYIIRAKGDSMADYINNMDWIGIKMIHDKEVISYGNAYAIVTKDLQLIKYIRKGSKGNYLLSSRNKDYDDFELPITKVLDLFIIKTVLKIKTII